MSDIRELCGENYILDRMTQYWRSIFKNDNEPLLPFIRTARLIESITFGAFTCYVCVTAVRASISNLQPGLIAGVGAGAALALSMHQIRKTVLKDKRYPTVTHPYTIPFSTLYHDAFSILKGKWQVLEATLVGVLGIAILRAGLNLTKVHPYAMGLISAITMGATLTYAAVDYIIARNFRQI